MDSRFVDLSFGWRTVRMLNRVQDWYQSSCFERPTSRLSHILWLYSCCMLHGFPLDRSLIMRSAWWSEVVNLTQPSLPCSQPLASYAVRLLHTCVSPVDLVFDITSFTSLVCCLGPELIKASQRCIVIYTDSTQNAGIISLKLLSWCSLLSSHLISHNIIPPNLWTSSRYLPSYFFLKCQPDGRRKHLWGPRMSQPQCSARVVDPPADTPIPRDTLAVWIKGDSRGIKGQLASVQYEKNKSIVF